MSSGNVDPFDNLSPSPSYTQDLDTYHDLLGVQVPIEDSDLSKPDFQEEHAQQSHTPPIANMVNQQVENSDTTAGRQGLGPPMMELCNLDLNPAEMSANPVNNLESAAITTGAPSSHPKQKKPLKIKKESQDTPFTSGIAMNTIDDPMEISDTEEADSVFKHGTKMSDGVIILSDGEDQEIIVFDDGSTSVAIKKENPDVEFLGATRGLVDISDSEGDEPTTAAALKLGTSFLGKPNPRAKHTPADIERMHQMQRLYAEKALARNIGSEPGKALANPKVLSGLGLDFRNQSSNDEFAWMKEVVSLDDAPATTFGELKKVYKAKRKARQNTLEDDVEFKKAQNEENQRLKRLAQETADTDSDDEAEESDDGLFVPQGPSFGSKRPFSSMVDIIDDDDDDEEVVPLGTSVSKKPKPVQADLSTKKSRAKALQKELKCNMLAGIEALLLRDQKRIEQKAGKAADNDTGRDRSKKASRKQKTSDLSAKRTKTGRMNNIGSLLTSNIYEDSNANLDRQTLPVVTEKKRKEFMSSLIANIPVEDQKQAKSDKIDILKAATLLASRKVRPDGQGHWNLKGMKSSLYHYQVTGAAYMKMRETGEQHPYGGILADEMGLGKTVQMLATMIANRQTDPEEPKCTLIVCSPALMGQCEFWLGINAVEV